MTKNAPDEITSINKILSIGDVTSGYRSRRKARDLMPEFKSELGLTHVDPMVERCLEDFIIDVVLGAAWYTRKYLQANRNTWLYIMGNAALVIAIPGLLFLISRCINADQLAAVVAQLSGLLSGILALQKTLSAWFVQQQQYANWYQCATSLKQIFYTLVRQHANAGADAALIKDLQSGADAAKKIMDGERLIYYQNLVMPTMSVLDMLTGSGNSVAQIVAGMMPAKAPDAAAAQGFAAQTGALGAADPTPDLTLSPPAPAPVPSMTQLGQIANIVSAKFAPTSVSAPAALPSFGAAVVANCTGIPISNVSDLQTFFFAAGGFFNWYNAALSHLPAFKERRQARNDAEINDHFDQFWSHFAIAFDKPSITMIEFCALMSISIQETTGDLTAKPEEVNGMAHPHPGLAYAFDAIGSKDSYNMPPNRTALQLFKDPIFVAAHMNLAGANAVLGRAGGIDPAWGGQSWPVNFNATPEETVNGFVMQADFYKFRGRGVIQTTWRDDYLTVLNFLLNADLGSHPDIAPIRDRWAAGAARVLENERAQYILTISTTDEWDIVFSNPLVLASGVHIDSATKGNYLQLSHDANILNGTAGMAGSLLHMASRINGGNYPATVVPMMKTMMCGIAALATKTEGNSAAEKVVV